MGVGAVGAAAGCGQGAAGCVEEAGGVSWWRPLPLSSPSRRVRVHWTTTAGAELATDGFLIGVIDDHYVLRRAELRRGEDNVEPLTGTIEIPVRRVEFLQVLGGNE